MEDFVNIFDLIDFVLVGDSGLINKENIALIEEKQYKYIIGARIKNEYKTITTLKIRIPLSNETMTKTMLLTL